MADTDCQRYCFHRPDHASLFIKGLNFFTRIIHVYLTCSSNHNFPISKLISMILLPINKLLWIRLDNVKPKNGRNSYVSLEMNLYHIHIHNHFISKFKTLKP